MTFNDEKKIIPRDGDAEGGGHGGGKAGAEVNVKKTSRWKKWRQKKKAQTEGSPKSSPQQRDFSSTRAPALKQKEKFSESHPRGGEQESHCSEVGDDEVQEALSGFRTWLKDNDVSGLSVAQMGAHLLLQIKKSKVNLGRYMERMLASPNEGQEGERQRGVLPLPCLDDSFEVISQVLDSGEYKRLAGSWSQKKAMNTAKIHREMRKKGMLIWHFLVVTSINFMWNGMRSTGRVCRKKATVAQKAIQDRIWQAVRVFMDDTSETSEKLLKSPGYEDWHGKLDGVRISYQGQAVPKAQLLTLEQILPGLPPEGYGGCVQLVDLCEGLTKDRLLDPAKCVLSGEELPLKLPQPKVMAKEDDWNKIAAALYQRGLVRPVDNVAKVDDQMILNGAFGVPKPGKTLEDGRDILRFIMDFRAVNSVMKIIEGDVRTLTGAPAFQHIVMPMGSVIRISADDLVSAFYLFGLPKAWSQLMAFNVPVKWKSLGIEKEGETYVGACVLPMGWSSAVGLMQHAHRRLALRGFPGGGAGLLPGLEIRRDEIFPEVECDGGAAWSLYLDDMTIIELLEEKAAKSVEGIYSLGDPHQQGQSAAEGVLDGEKGLLRCSSKRALASLSLAAMLMRQEYPSKKAMQVFAGKEAHGLQFRRPMFSILDEVWKEIAKDSPQCHMTGKVVGEILLLNSLQVMKYTDLKAGLSEVVSASDACESGGGTVYANKLSSKGLMEVVAIEEEVDNMRKEYLELDGKQNILVLDFFAGIGGLSRALQLAEVEVHTLVVIEKDPDCRRLHRRRWPGCKLVTDIRSVTKAQIASWMDGVSGITGVIAGGGSPCQGISKLSVLREGLEDPRSALFYLLVERLKWVQELAVERNIWNIRFCENVLGDDETIQEMSAQLYMNPLEVCSSDISRVRRPRLYILEWSGPR